MTNIGNKGSYSYSLDIKTRKKRQDWKKAGRDNTVHMHTHYGIYIIYDIAKRVGNFSLSMYRRTSVLELN